MRKVFILWLAFCLATSPILSNAFVAPALGSGWKLVNGAQGANFVRDGAVNASRARANELVWEQFLSGGAKFRTNDVLNIGKTAPSKFNSTGLVTAAGLLAGLGGLAIGGPGGLAITVLGPAFIDWLADGGIRPAQGPNAPGSPLNPNRLPFELPDPGSCSSLPCYEWRHSSDPTRWFTTSVAACEHGGNRNPTYFYKNVRPSDLEHCIADAYLRSNGSLAYKDTSVSINVRPSGVRDQNWLPASFDDISPYLLPRGPSPALMDIFLNNGASFDTETTTISGPATVDQGEAKFNTVLPTLPSVVESVSSVPGTPGGPPLTTSGTKGAGYRDVRIDGVPQFTGGGMSTPMLGTVVALPVSVTTTSVYNPATGVTTTTVTKNFPGGSVQQVAKSETTLSYATTGGLANVNTTTKTTVTTTVKDLEGNTISQTTGTETDAKPPLEVQTCGMPNTPACKIDETGTPKTAEQTFTQPKTDLDTTKDQVSQAIDKAATITAPTWTFSFQLPTGCAPYVTGLRGVILNICQYQSTIHDLMSMIWAATTAFVLVGMVGRTIRES